MRPARFKFWSCLTLAILSLAWLLECLWDSWAVVSQKNDNAAGDYRTKCVVVWNVIFCCHWWLLGTVIVGLVWSLTVVWIQKKWQLPPCVAHEPELFLGFQINKERVEYIYNGSLGGLGLKVSGTMSVGPSKFENSWNCQNLNWPCLNISSSLKNHFETKSC